MSVPERNLGAAVPPDPPYKALRKLIMFNAGEREGAQPPRRNAYFLGALISISVVLLTNQIRSLF